MKFMKFLLNNLIINIMESTIKSFYERLGEAGREIDYSITNERYIDVPVHVHNVMLLFDCIQRSNDQSFIHSIVKDAAQSLAVDAAETITTDSTKL